MNYTLNLFNFTLKPKETFYVLITTLRSSRYDHGIVNKNHNEPSFVNTYTHTQIIHCLQDFHHSSGNIVGHSHKARADHNTLMSMMFLWPLRSKAGFCGPWSTTADSSADCIRYARLSLTDRTTSRLTHQWRHSIWEIY